VNIHSILNHINVIKTLLPILKDSDLFKRKGKPLIFMYLNTKDQRKTVH
jgi:hypothetical protein